MDKLDSLAAFAKAWLCDDIFSVLDKILDIIIGYNRKILEISLYKILEVSVELVLVIENICLGRIVQKLVKTLVLDTRHVGLTFLSLHVVILKNEIIVEAGTVFDSAADHVQKDQIPALSAGFLFNFVNAFRDSLQTETAKYAE